MSNLANFYHTIQGQGEKKLVFLHGLMGYGSNWRTLAKSFEGDFQILLYDQRGHGKSMKPASGYHPEDYAQDLFNILQELGWNEIYLVGHSMGGRNALNFSFRFPQCVKKLVIEDIGPESDPAGEKGIRDMLDVIPVPFASKQDARDFFSNQFAGLYRGSENPRTLGLFLYANLIETQKGFDWRFSLDGILQSVHHGRTSDRWHELEALKMPVLLIRGERSRDLSAAVFQRMLASNSHIRGVEIPGAGHWVHADKPEAVVEELRKFFAE